MIAKVVAWAKTRELAIARLQQALQQVEVSGLITNLGFLQCLLRDQAFQNLRMHTQYIDRELDTLLATLPVATEEQLGLAALAHLARLARANAAHSSSPWVTLGSWRSLTPSRRRFGLQHGDARYAVEVESRGNAHKVRINGGAPESFQVIPPEPDQPVNVISWQKAEVMHTMHYYGDDDRLELFSSQGTLSFNLEPDYQLNVD